MMTENNHNSIIHTNIHVFYNIAHEAYAAMTDDLNESRKPKPDGKPGYIMKFDPEQKSFKNAFITIIFCGIFLESLLHLLIVKKKGLDVFNEYDRKPYEKKLKLLGCNDQSILGKCKHYRDARREIVHEKAHLDDDSFRVAQNEAAFAMELIKEIRTYFNLK